MEKYVHRCTVPSGSMAGNKVATEVTALDVEMGRECEFCGEPLATLDDLTLHMYEQLTDEQSTDG